MEPNNPPSNMPSLATDTTAHTTTFPRRHGHSTQTSCLLSLLLLMQRLLSTVAIRGEHQNTEHHICARFLNSQLYQSDVVLAAEVLRMTAEC